MKTAAVIQARMGSSRFPGKALVKLGERTVLEHVIRRCQLSNTDEVIVATTWKEEDSQICAFCKSIGVPWFRGSEANVLERVLGACRHFNVTRMVRVNADCPLVDPLLIDRLLEEDQKSNYKESYIGYRLSDGRPAIQSPAGLPELIAVECLAYLLDVSKSMQEHVTFGVYHEQTPRCHWIDIAGYDDQRHAIDTEEDLLRISKLCKFQSTVT